MVIVARMKLFFYLHCCRTGRTTKSKEENIRNFKGVTNLSCNKPIFINLTNLNVFAALILDIKGRVESLLVLCENT